MKESAIAIVVALAAGCSSMKINNDYDQQADFSSFKTYSWYETDSDLKENYPLAHQRLVQAVDTQMAAKGFSKVVTNPDAYVTYHTDDNQQVRIDSTSFGYGYGPGWRWGGGVGMGSTTSTVRSYTVGTLIVDIWDARQKRLAWRGIASDTVSDNPGSNEKKIKSAAEKMFKNYPPTGGS